MKWLFIVAVVVALSIHSAHAEDLGCVSTTFKALSPNDKVCVSVFEDPQVPGVACHISQARKGGWGQPFGSFQTGSSPVMTRASMLSSRHSE